VLPTFLNAAGLKQPEVLDGRSFVPVLTGKETKHKDFVFGLMTTRGIINGSDHFGIRSVRSGQYKYIVNLTSDVKFQNACVKLPSFLSWKKKAESGDAEAAEVVRRYEYRPAEELFDVTQDQLEWKNLADDPTLSQMKAELRKQLAMWMESQGDKGAQTEMEALEHLARNQKKATTPVKKKAARSGKKKNAKSE
jgi:N-sulfoglucosamine sulfohydrolase